MFQVVSARVINASDFFLQVCLGELSTVIIFIIICLDRLDLQTWNEKFQTSFQHLLSCMCRED